MKKALPLLLIMVLVLGILTGCGTQTAKQATDPTDQTNKVNSAQTNYPLTIKDDSGTEVSIPAKPERIICILPSATETLFAIGAGNNVIAVTKYDNNPVNVQKKVEYVFQDTLNPNIEQIVKLKPDLIILGEISPTTTAAIRNLKIPVIVSNPQDLANVYTTIKEFGKITDTQASAAKVINSMQNEERAIEKKVALVKDTDRPKVWIEVDPTLYTAGSGTFMDELVSKAGGINIAANVKGWVQYSSEKVMAANPQVILYTYGEYNVNAKQTIMKRPGWQDINAVKNNRVVELNSDLVTEPGPRIIDGMESIAKALYPSLFQ
ncbi:ABC transporter substrate-binding protein [Desulfosporosinus sp. FKA]|uniref:ABC transporter substrate-binding protein n=1 Tax=Desulfosporosinus sp. FKA TaxID=1969834 RepID=UPI000B49E4B2|nr:ABC transporter substrate-binding protein [Desulfosporosinus sp. FKA]